MTTEAEQQLQALVSDNQKLRSALAELRQIGDKLFDQRREQVDQLRTLCAMLEEVATERDRLRKELQCAQAVISALNARGCSRVSKPRSAQP